MVWIMALLSPFFRKEDGPKTGLFLLNTSSGAVDTFENVQSFQFSNDSKWLVYHSFKDPVKAAGKDADKLLFTRQSYREFPDLWVSDTDLKKSKKLSDVNPQTAEFGWGDAELVEWTTISKGNPPRSGSKRACPTRESENKNIEYPSTILDFRF